MKIIDTNNLKIVTDSCYNRILEHPFTLEINGSTHEVLADVYTECDSVFDKLFVRDFCISLINEEGFYTDEQTEEIEGLLTRSLRPY